MKERVEKLKNQLLGVKPSITSERLTLATEAYKKFAGEPAPIFRAKVLSYVLNHMTIIIADGELIVGTQSNKLRCPPIFPELSSVDLWLYDEIDKMPDRKCDPFDIEKEDAVKIKEGLEYWRGKSIEDITTANLPKRIREAQEDGVISIGGMDGTTGHITPNYNRLLTTGLSGTIRTCEELIDKHVGGSKEVQEKIDFWKACIITCEGVIQFAHRYAKKAEELAQIETDEKRKRELEKISSNCRKVPENPPEDFHEALQFVWFVHLISHIELNSTGCGFGRFDQYMYPYYKKDMKERKITDEYVIELLQLFYIKVTSMMKLRTSYYSQAFAGYPMWQILMIGGQDLEGNDASNELSYLVLDAMEEVQMAQPPIAFRYFEGTSEKLFEKAVRMVQKGIANPAFFNDKVSIPIVLAKGGTLEEARDWVIVGCIEPHPGQGTSDGSPVVGYMNGLKCLEIVLHNGVDPITGKKIGLETGDPNGFTTKEELIEAVKRQLVYFWNLMLTGYNINLPNHIHRVPAIFSGIAIDGCIEKGMSVQQGGAKHSYSGTFFCGAANIADSIAAIDTLVFQEKKITMQELIDACDRNFEGDERLRQLLINHPAKFGNDNAYVDSIARDIVNYCCEYVQGRKDSRGGQYCVSNLSQTMNVTHGACVGATPDGRKAFEPLSDNASPAMGRDISGPTATVNSVAHLDQVFNYDGALFNLRFDPRGVEGEKGVGIIGGVIKSYFENYGEHIQINVVDNETLRKAQKEPEKYRGLQVRVAGYLAYFTELDPTVQETIIERTAHLA